MIIGHFSFVQAESYPKDRPNASDGPTKIEVGLYILDIEDVDNKEQSFTADVIIRLQWKDNRLAGIESPLSLHAIWNPRIQIYNLRDVDTRFPEVVQINQDGTVQYTQRYRSRQSGSFYTM